MVFASLVEYAVVSYMNKKLAQRRERRRKQAEQQMPVEMPMYNQTTSRNILVRFYFKLSLGVTTTSYGCTDIFSNTAIFRNISD